MTEFKQGDRVMVSGNDWDRWNGAGVVQGGSPAGNYRVKLDDLLIVDVTADQMELVEASTPLRLQFDWAEYNPFGKVVNFGIARPLGHTIDSIAGLALREHTDSDDQLDEWWQQILPILTTVGRVEIDLGDGWSLTVTSREVA